MRNDSVMVSAYELYELLGRCSGLSEEDFTFAGEDPEYGDFFHFSRDAACGSGCRQAMEFFDDCDATGAGSHVLGAPSHHRRFSIGDDGRFAGYGAVFNQPDEQPEIILPGAFRRSLTIKHPKLLYEHIVEEPIGVWEKVYEDDYGLRCEGVIDLDMNLGAHARAAVRAGAVSGLSIGFNSIVESRGQGGARLIEEADLWEVSLVIFPMQREAMLDGLRRNRLPKNSILPGLSRDLKRFQRILRS